MSEGGYHAAPPRRRRAGRPFLYAHRGSHRNAPENTLRAFEHALAEGADGVELDVRQCASGEVVVAHDDDLGRVAGDTRRVCDVPWGVLREIELQGGGRIPLLADAVDAVAGAGAWLNVEIKHDHADLQGLSDAVTATLMRAPAAHRQRLWLSSFHPLLLRMLRERLPGVSIAYLFDAQHVGVRSAEHAIDALQPDGVHPEHVLVDTEAVARWQARGLFVHAWVVDDRERARALAGAGVDGLITDDVPALAALDRNEDSP